LTPNIPTDLMELIITHSLHYQYDMPVGLLPHTLHLSPRPQPNLRVLAQKLHIEPAPVFVSTHTDGVGNTQQVIFFENKTTELQLQTELHVLTDDIPAFWHYPAESAALPVSYPAMWLETLQPYLSRQGITTLVDQMARNLASEAGWQMTEFLNRLNAYIRQQLRYEVREMGWPKAPETTLIEGVGSCRDYAVLFVACCRAMGLAARFVSGYYFLNPHEPQHLHAWAEVYMPGGGWRGYDPTQNCLVGAQHVALAAAAVPELVTPVSGSFTGKTQSHLGTSVQIRAV
jgi:transglutaminase-like putative cysteine protease